MGIIDLGHEPAKKTLRYYLAATFSLRMLKNVCAEEETFSLVCIKIENQFPIADVSKYVSEWVSVCVCVGVWVCVCERERVETMSAYSCSKIRHTSSFCHSFSCCPYIHSIFHALNFAYSILVPSIKTIVLPYYKSILSTHKLICATVNKI